MDAERSRRGLIPILIALMLVLAVPQAAAAGGGSGPERAARLVAQLEQAADPNAAFAALSPKDQRLVVSYLTVVEVEEASFSDRAQASDADGLTAAAASTCYTFTKRFDGKNTFGGVLFSYFLKVNWCGNGSTITSTPSSRRWGQTYYAYWFFNGHIDWSSSGGYGKTFYQAFTQGSFSFCPPILGCVQGRYPYIGMTVYPNGGVSGSMGG